MGLFDLLKKGSKKRVLPVQEIVKMAQIHEPQSIYYPDGQHLVPEVERAVNAIMPLYDGISNLSTMLMLNDPSEMQKNIKNADVDTLLIFFKFFSPFCVIGCLLQDMTSRRKACISSIPQELYITNSLPLYIIIAKEDTACG